MGKGGGGIQTLPDVLGMDGIYIFYNNLEFAGVSLSLIRLLTSSG